MNQAIESTEEAVEAKPEETRREIDEPKPYVMPQPRVGKLVAWYPQAVTSGRPHNAIVVAVHSNTVHLMSLEMGQIGFDLQEVRHVDDPLLKSNEWVRRQYGGWDYSPEEKHLETQNKLLAVRLAAIEKRLTSLENKKAK